MEFGLRLRDRWSNSELRFMILDLRVACGKQAMCCRNHIAKMALPFWLKLGYLYLENFEVYYSLSQSDFSPWPLSLLCRSCALMLRRMPRWKVLWKHKRTPSWCSPTQQAQYSKMEGPPLRLPTPFGKGMISVAGHLRRALLKQHITPTQTDGEMLLAMCYAQKDDLPAWVDTFSHLMLGDDLCSWVTQEVGWTEDFRWICNLALEEVTPPIEDEDREATSNALAFLLKEVTRGAPTMRYTASDLTSSGGQRQLVTLLPAASESTSTSGQMEALETEATPGDRSYHPTATWERTTIEVGPEAHLPVGPLCWQDPQHGLGHGQGPGKRMDWPVGWH